MFAHAGALANLAVYLMALKPGDSVLGMDLGHGGHLPHGSPVNISGKYFNFHSYGVDPQTGLIDLEEVKNSAKGCPPPYCRWSQRLPKETRFCCFQGYC